MSPRTSAIRSVPATPHTNDDLFHAPAARARRTSDGRLVLAVLCGLAAARSSSVVVLRIARICSVVLGTCAAILAVLVVLGRVLGTWIS